MSKSIFQARQNANAFLKTLTYFTSLQELNEILANKTIVNSTCTSNGGTSLSEVDGYWSSSVGTADNNRVWEVDMSNGNNAEALRGGNNNVVRAVRAFQFPAFQQSGFVIH